jgi:hypothetical protein
MKLNDSLYMEVQMTTEQNKNISQKLFIGFPPPLNDLKEKLIDEFPLGVPRKYIGQATGRILHPRTMANLDSLGQGIEGRFKIGRHTIYPVDCIIRHIKKKIHR